MPLRLINLHSAVVKLPISAMNEIAGANGKGEISLLYFLPAAAVLAAHALGFYIRYPASRAPLQRHDASDSTFSLSTRR